MNVLGTAILLVGLLATVSLSCKHSPGALQRVADEDYQVYSAYLNDFIFYPNIPPTGQIVIYDSTSMSPADIDPRTPWSWVRTYSGNRCFYENDSVTCQKVKDPVWVSLFDSLKKLPQRSPVHLLPKFDVHAYKPILGSRAFITQLVEHEPALTHYVFTFSSIIYNANKTKSLFFSSFYCGGTCGRGELIMLEKVNQTWNLIDCFRFWIA
ncbi:hypothetical protein WBJ53_24940 [Spirosoma sp. SC4-14]|uniref:hypothetical protein n=1 Tax=Spirosoma sp. SC4-14 TaxID=3128900 RepID=UPI0030D3D180